MSSFSDFLDERQKESLPLSGAKTDVPPPPVDVASAVRALAQRRLSSHNIHSVVVVDEKESEEEEEAEATMLTSITGQIMSNTAQLWDVFLSAAGEGSSSSSSPSKSELVHNRCVELFDRSCVCRGVAQVAATTLRTVDVARTLRPSLAKLGMWLSDLDDEGASYTVVHVMLPTYESDVVRVKRECIERFLSHPANVEKVQRGFSGVNAILRLELTTQFQRAASLMQQGCEDREKVTAAAVTRWKEFVGRYGGHPMCRPVLFSLVRLVTLQRRIMISNKTKNDQNKYSNNVARLALDNHVFTLSAGPHFTRDLVFVLASFGLVPHPSASAWDFTTLRGSEKQFFIYPPSPASRAVLESVVLGVVDVMGTTNAAMTRDVTEEPIAGAVDYFLIRAPASAVREDEDEDGDDDFMEIGRGRKAKTKLAPCQGCCVVA